jgi:hypothetical protein
LKNGGRILDKITSPKFVIALNPVCIICKSIVLKMSEENVSSNSSKLHNAKFSFNPNGYWDKAIDWKSSTSKVRMDFTNPTTAISMLALFDQNGYDLTELEKLYSTFNDDTFLNHRTHRFAIKKPWYYQIPDAVEGPVINHCYLFERKGYSGAAKEQLESWAKGTEEIPGIPLYHKLLAMKPKWGIDFSMDYVDRSGNVFEVFHYEYDCFSAAEAEEAKARLEKVIETTDWNEAAKILLQRKEEWIHLPFFEQSDWKCAFFGLPSEKFKTVVWA